MECKRVQHHLDAYHSGCLSPLLIEKVDKHLAGCTQCQSQLQQVRQLDHLLDRQTSILAPEDFTLRVMNQIHAHPPLRKSSPFIPRQWGMSLLAAGLLLFFLNLTPLSSSLSPLPRRVNDTTSSMINRMQSWSIEGIGEGLTNGFYDFTDFITRPITGLKNIFEKEGNHHVL